MNLHVQQSVHVLAAQTYCQIAVSGGGAVKGVRHLKTMIPIPFHRVALNVEIIDGNCCSRWKKKKKTIFPSIFESQSRDLTWFRSARLRGATRYRSSVDKMSDTSGLKRSDSPHKPNVDSRKIVLSLFTAQPSSIVSLKPCNVLLYRSLYIAVYIQIRSYARKVKKIRLNRKM